MTTRLFKAVLRAWNQLGPLDRVALLASLILAVMVIAIISVGDRVGVPVVEAYPVGLANETSLVSFRFNEAMDRSSVAAHFGSLPGIEGEITWKRDRMVFQPRANFKADTEYRFTIRRGAKGQSGREVLDDYEITFKVSDSILLFKRSDDRGIANIWAVDSGDPETATQLTRSSGGVGEFEPSPDGRNIAFTERDELAGNFSLKLLDLDIGGDSTLTDPREADAFNPSWHPDGAIIAFERIDRPEGTTERIPIPRIWAVDLFTSPPTVRRLIANADLPGYSPKWSPDGRRIAWGADSPESSGPGVYVYDFIAAEFDFHDTLMNTLHAFSNDGARLIFPLADSSSGGVETALSVVDVETGEARMINTRQEPAVDKFLAWSPDDRTIALVRRHRATQGAPGHQPYLLDPDSGDFESVGPTAVHDANTVAWSPSGQLLSIWRTQRWDVEGAVLDDPQDEVWIHDTTSGETRLLIADATSPKWLP